MLFYINGYSKFWSAPTLLNEIANNGFKESIQFDSVGMILSKLVAASFDPNNIWLGIGNVIPLQQATKIGVAFPFTASSAALLIL